MNLLQSVLLCRSNTEDEQQQQQQTEKPKQLQKPKTLEPQGRHLLFSLRFLYKNPIGRALLTERASNNWRKSIHLAASEPKLAEDAQLAEYVRSVPNAIRYKGLLLQGYLVYPKVLKQIESFEVRPTDVWLATYPKSGTTWTEEILSLIFSDGHASQKLLAERVPHLEVGKPVGHVRWLRRLPSPRLIATHLDVEHVPTQLRHLKAKVSVPWRRKIERESSLFYSKR